MKIAVDNIENWIFVTGVIRSGTTFVGKILSQPLSVDYIHEPFLGGYTLPERVELRPRYVRPEAPLSSIARYRDQLDKLFRYEIGMRSSKYDEDPWLRKALKAVVGSRGPFYLRLAKANPFHTAAVIKDPVARMVTEYLYRQYRVKPVVIVRHPVSWIASLKRVEWFPEMKEFAEQEDLVEDYFAGERDFVERTWPSRMLESAAHWRATYKVLLRQAEAYGDWHVITHERLSERPVETFRSLYQELGLPWSERIEDTVEGLTSSNHSARAREGRVQDFRRDSSKIFELRRNSVPLEERRAIFDIVEDVALQMYDRETFALEEEVSGHS